MEFNNTISIMFDDSSNESKYEIVGENGQYVYFLGHCGEWLRYLKASNELEQLTRDGIWSIYSSTLAIIHVDTY